MLSRIAAIVLSFVVVVGASPAVADDPVPVGLTIRIDGHGFGHGHGLSQYGAQNAALQGRSYRQILDFYYPGTGRGSAAGKVKVLISADRSRDVVVAARPGLSVKEVGARGSIDLTQARPRAKKWRITPLSGGRSRIDYRVAAWRRLSVIRGEAEFSAKSRPIKLYVTKRRAVQYRGVLRSAANDTVNILPLDSYLQGVVPREVPALWDPDAVRAQAVAARTYAAYERLRPLARHYQICDTDQCQVYGGYSDEHPAATAAIRATGRQIVTSGGKPAFAQFSASSGGWTSAGAFGYLPAKQDPYDRWSGNPYADWTTTVPAAAVEAAYPAIGNLTSVQVTRRDGNGEWGGRVEAITLNGDATSTSISGDTFRSVFGLRSSWFLVS